MAELIQLKRGTKAYWESVNPILAHGEVGYELETASTPTSFWKTKLGDGVTVWNSLPYRGASSTDTLNLGYFGTELELTTAYPIAIDGNYAVVGVTDTVWVWDTDTTAWVDSGNELGSIPINSVGATELKPEVEDNILWKDNIEIYTPITDYHPATKKYVDENAGATEVDYYYNTKIGGIGSTTTTPSLLANLLGILEADIENFRIDGTDILCKINVDYEIPTESFADNLEITSYWDYNGKVTIVNENGFGAIVTGANTGTVNLTHVYLPNCTRLYSEAFSGGGAKKELIYIPNCTILGTDTNPADSDFVFWYGTFNNCTLVIHPFMEVANAGVVEQDITGNLEYAPYAFKEVIYSEQPVQVNGKMYGKNGVYDLRKENKIVTLTIDVIDWIDPNSTFLRTFTGTPTVTFTEVKKPLNGIVKTITINMTGDVTSIAFPTTYKKMESSVDYDGTKMNKYVFEFVNGRVDYSNSLSPL